MYFGNKLNKWKNVEDFQQQQHINDWKIQHNMKFSCFSHDKYFYVENVLKGQCIVNQKENITTKLF